MSNYSWTSIKEYKDIRFEYFEGIAKITICRPKVLNAFRPETNIEMIDITNSNVARRQNWSTCNEIIWMKPSSSFKLLTLKAYFSNGTWKAVILKRQATATKPIKLILCVFIHLGRYRKFELPGF